MLLKALEPRGIDFFTNYGSRKSRELTENPRAALVFPWHDMGRQVVVDGAVERLSERESDAYFATRPRGSQLSVWASRQSTVLGSREELEAAYAQAEERFPEGSAVSRPEWWGGWRLAPFSVEFWQGRPDRLHDRLRFRLAEGSWLVERLSP